MANYSDITEAIAAGITNMTVIRDGIKNDDGVDTVATEIDWFKFNSTTVSNVYCSGNSWIGFGVNNENYSLKVNRRDCACYYLYKETGTIGSATFFRIRWHGYSGYNKTSSTYSQQFEVFLFDTGQIYLNFFTVPTSYFNGTNALVCSTTVTYSVTSGTACDYTFTPSDSSTGTGWSAQSGYHVDTSLYKSSGYSIFSITSIHSITSVGLTEISWTEEKPENTSISVSASVDGTNYLSCTSGSSIPVISEHDDLSSTTLYVKVYLYTTDNTKTPKFKDLRITIGDALDKRVVIVVFAAGNVNSFQNAAGNITIHYDGLGTLTNGVYNVEAFDEEFTPTQLEFKGNVANLEHLEVSNMETSGTLTFITYNVGRSSYEHIEISTMSVAGTLTHIDDI